MKIEQRLLDDIRPCNDNPRKNDSAVHAVARSIREFGFRQPVVMDGEGVIIVGHTRWKAAKELGLERVPVYVADNQSASIAEWDHGLLPLELEGLREAGFDMDLLGFD